MPVVNVKQHQSKSRVLNSIISEDVHMTLPIYFSFPPPRKVISTKQRIEVAFQRAFLDHLFTVTVELCLLFVKKRFILFNREAVLLDNPRIIYIVLSCTLRVLAFWHSKHFQK